ncbi:hypothetical protein LOTGIDRAFT_113378 [Lottia gigantea]|uniref:Uncharacterized protein n=1 Tax=Lottia gigantea TaxID=225164 RepID=V4B036_LOTGI|nr:hypothetical protein LOTGIDRAFT_113378 [Lottia gigantea]ESO99381.1 hypothetical protein LOTGIDRAFT_113378 [Lottia gigantea]
MCRQLVLFSIKATETFYSRSTLEDQLSIINYQKRLTALMHCEEIQMEVDIRQYDMEEATMTVCPENKRLLVLKVPGLAENRPSVLRGDWLFIRVVDSDDKEYKGYVHEVRKNEVLLGFHKSLLEKMTPLTKFSVRFVFNRLPVKLQHRAIDYINTHKNDYEALLFPTEDQIGKYGLMKPLNVELR